LALVHAAFVAVWLSCFHVTSSAQDVPTFEGEHFAPDSVGQSLDSPQPSSAHAALPQGLRGLKRLSGDEIAAEKSDSLSLYALREDERTLILDFPNVREQSRMFARLVLFVERAGTPKTRVMTVDEVKNWLSQNGVALETLTVGNNMKTGELARFFNSARFQGEPITVQEQRLYDWLLQLQLLRQEDSGVAVVGPERILVSIPQASSVAGCPACSITVTQRAVIVQHELAHARFATDTIYQHYVLWFWSNAMSPDQRDKFQKFLGTRGYDSGNSELCANEMQAFLMHTPDARLFSAANVAMTENELADLRKTFADGLGPKRATVEKAYRIE
jgi:hypothetical protein